MCLNDVQSPSLGNEYGKNFTFLLLGVAYLMETHNAEQWIPYWQFAFTNDHLDIIPTPICKNYGCPGLSSDVQQASQAETEARTRAGIIKTIFNSFLNVI